MKNTKKILSCVLALAMLFSCIGMSVFAAADDDLTTENFSLAITEADSSLSVALVCNKDVSIWAGGAGFMSITDGSGADASAYFTLGSIVTVIGDKNDALNQAKWSATANDFDNGDYLNAGTWTTYNYTVANAIPDGTYTFTMTFSDGDCYDNYFEDYSISGQTVTADYTVGSELERVEALVYGGASVRDANDQPALAFKFDMLANDIQVENVNEYVANTGSLKLYKNADVIGNLKGFGAVVTNKTDVGADADAFTVDAVDGKKVIDIPAKYLMDLEADCASFAVRILNIPANKLDAEIYARPYYIYELDGEECIVYGDIVHNNYAAVGSAE